MEQPRSVEPTPAHGLDILLICVDTLRADHVGMYGYHRATTPRIDSFFASGRRFEIAYATAPSTAPSVISFLTGLYPHQHGVRLLLQKLPAHVTTVADCLNRAGYQTGAVVSNAVLADKACALGGRFGFYDDKVDEQEPYREVMFERRAARTTDAAIRWLRHVRDPNRPHFLWVHYIDPHGPYRPPADKPIDFRHGAPHPIDAERVPAYAREPDIDDGLEYVDRYDEEIAYTDREIGRLLDEYTRLGLAGHAAVIFTSDHGESMMERDFWFQHQLTVYEEMVRVPLVLRVPGVEPGTVDTPVTIADIAPTILELALQPVPERIDGRSLLTPPSPRDILCESRAQGGGLWEGVIRGRRKVMARHGMSNIIRESLAFDLTLDPRELSPLPVKPGNPMLQILERIIAAHDHPGGLPREYARGELPAPGVAPATDPSVLEKLRSLGYIDN